MKQDAATLIAFMKQMPEGAREVLDFQQGEHTGLLHLVKAKGKVYVHLLKLAHGCSADTIPKAVHGFYSALKGAPPPPPPSAAGIPPTAATVLPLIKKAAGRI